MGSGLKNDILIVDGAREVIGIGLNSLDYSLNDTNKDHLLEAKAKLDTLTPNLKAIVGDEIKMLMANEEASIGLVWSGDAAESCGKMINWIMLFQRKAPIFGSIIWSSRKQRKI